MTLGNIDGPGQGFAHAMEDQDASVSVYITMFKDNTLEYSIAHNEDLYGEAVPLGEAIRVLYSAAEAIVADANAKESHDEN